MLETKDDDKLAIPLEDYDRVIAEVAQTNTPEVTKLTDRLFRSEVLVLLFGERFQGWFEGFRQIFTIVFVPILFFLTFVWLLFIGYLIWQAAFHRQGFGLSDAVLIALITTTTATVLGLFHYANRWMFDTRPKDSDKSNSN